MTRAGAGRLSQIVLALHAAVLASLHGAFALRQGPVAIDSPGLYSAIGPPCEPANTWHACLPALTVAPDLRTAGALTLTVALLTAFAALRRSRRTTPAALGVASATLLLVGGGFVPALTAALAATASAPSRARRNALASPFREDSRVAPSRARREAPATRVALGGRGRADGSSAAVLARAWPWALGAFLAWALGGWWLGAVANDALVRLGGATFLLDIALPVAVVVTARARVALGSPR